MSRTQRVGIGYDIHRLQAGHGLTLAGIRIPCEWSFVAHSDGDVVLHAICDAILGARGAGDLGEWFPDTAPEHKGRNSEEFVHTILQSDMFTDWSIINIDVNIIAQKPRLLTHKPAMRENLTRIFSVPNDCIGLKARTNEQCDAVGKSEALIAQAVVLIEK